MSGFAVVGLYNHPLATACCIHLGEHTVRFLGLSTIQMSTFFRTTERLETVEQRFYSVPFNLGLGACA